MRDKPIEISQGSLGSLRVAVPSPFPNVGGEGRGGGEGRVRVHVGYGQAQIIASFFINSTSKLVTKLPVTRDWLIQHSNRISKLSELSSQMEMLGSDFRFSRAIAFCDCKIAILSRTFVQISLI